jgi:hypothetical protein
MKWTVWFVCAAAFGQVPYDRIVNAEKEPGNWLTYSGNYSGHRFSPLSQITPANISGLHCNRASLSNRTHGNAPIVVTWRDANSFEHGRGLICTGKTGNGAARRTTSQSASVRNRSPRFSITSCLSQHSMATWSLDLKRAKPVKRRRLQARLPRARDFEKGRGR